MERLWLDWPEERSRGVVRSPPGRLEPRRPGRDDYYMVRGKAHLTVAATEMFGSLSGLKHGDGSSLQALMTHITLVWIFLSEVINEICP